MLMHVCGLLLIAIGTWNSGHADTHLYLLYSRHVVRPVMWGGHADMQTDVWLLIYRQCNVKVLTVCLYLAFSHKLFDRWIFIVTQLFECSFNLDQQLGTCCSVPKHMMLSIFHPLLTA